MTWSEALYLIVVYGLASGAVVDAWNNGSIFAPLRAYAECMAGKRPLSAELAACPFCQSYHAPFWLLLVFWLPSRCLAGPAADLIQLVPLSLAATRASLILNGLLPEALRYQRERQP